MAKPHRMYKKVDQKAYSRKEYIRGKPQLLITKFQQGKLIPEKTKETYTIQVLSLEKAQIRNYSLEAFRRALVKRLSVFSETSFFFKLKLYPHIFIRENTYNIRAGADRTSTGMREAFGKIIGLCARVKRNQTILEGTFLKKIPLARLKLAFKTSFCKLPIKCYLKLCKI